MLNKELTDAMVAGIAARFRGLSDATRIRILARLQAGECTVSALAQELDVAQASMSKHLMLLRRLGFVQVRRAGAQAFCSICDPVVPTLCRLMCDGVARMAHEQHAALGLVPGQKSRKNR